MYQINWYKEVLKIRDEIIADTQRFLQIESVLDEQTATKDKPFGKGISDALSYMLLKGEEAGFLCMHVDGYAGHIEHGSGDKLIGILCHVDVVPPGEGWHSPPFAAEIRDGRIYARGALDDKGPTMACFYALKLLKSLKLPLQHAVRIILGTDEESQWRCVEHYFKYERMPDYGFAPDADFPIIYAEKGIVDFYMSKSYAETSGHAPFINDEDPLTLLSFYSGERLNMVPERAVVKLTGFSSKQHLLATQRSFEDYIKKINGNGYVTIEENQLVLETRGRSAHGSEPSKGINAAFLMLQFLKDLSLKKMDKQFVELLEWLFEKATQARFGDAWYDDMSGYLTLNVGKVMYLHQGKAGIGINLRYPVTASYDQVMKVIKVKAEEEQFHLDQLDHTSAHYVSPEHPLIKTLARVYREQTETHPQLLTIGGGTYARALRAGVAFGPLFPGKEDTAHQVNEYIEIEDLLKATAIYAQAIYELACIKNL